MARGIVLVMALTGCVPFWTVDRPAYEPPVHTHRVTEAEAYAICGAYACSIRGPDRCDVYLSEKADACDRKHEFSHCAGWNHDQRNVYRKDCG